MEQNMKKRAFTVRQLIFIVGGILVLGLGVAGVFLPLLPSVPFFLLSVFLFMGGIPPLGRVISRTRIYKLLFLRFTQGYGINLPAKIIITLFVWAMVLPMFFVSDMPVIKILAIVLPSLHTMAFIFFVKTDKGEDKKSD